VGNLAAAAVGNLAEVAAGRTLAVLGNLAAVLVPHILAAVGTVAALPDSLVAEVGILAGLVGSPVAVVAHRIPVVAGTGLVAEGILLAAGSLGKTSLSCRTRLHSVPLRCSCTCSIHLLYTQCR